MNFPYCIAPKWQDWLEIGQPESRAWAAELQYFQMSLTLFLGIIAGTLVAIGSALAGQLAARERWQKWLFWGTGLIAVLLIGFQSYLNEKAQGDLAAKIDAINENTQVALHTNLDILPPNANYGWSLPSLSGGPQRDCGNTVR
jgi:hypothetical protein